MKTSFFTSLLLSGIFLLPACEEPISGDKLENQAPETRLFLDTVNTVTNALVDLYWDGDDPDGSVIGFLYSLDSGMTWTFTPDRKVSVVIPTGGKTIALSRVFVSAVDDAGNGRFDQLVYFNGKAIGSEFFTDIDSSGTYSSGEPYVDYGRIDPTPASALFTVRNSPPVASFNLLGNVPASTLPVVSVILSPSDPDGNNTIIKYELALNDTSAAAWTEIPVGQTIITLAADSRDTLSNSPAMEILTGSKLQPTGLTLNGLKVNDNNRLYFRTTDNAGVVSAYASMPDSSANWFVKKYSSAGELLVIRDHSNGDADKWKTILAKTPDVSGAGFYKADFIELKKSNGDPNLATGSAVVMLRAILSGYKKVIWYGANNTSLEYAQQTVPEYISSINKFGKKGRMLFRTGFDRSAPTLDLPLSFLPIDSVNYTHYFQDGKTGNGFISSIITDGGIRKDSLSSTFPIAKPDAAFFNKLPDSLIYSGFGTAVQNSYFSFVPNSNAYVLYRQNFPRKSFGENWPVNPEKYFSFGTPVTMVENLDRNFVFTTIPLIYLDKVTPGYPKNGFDNPLVELLALILNEEFERP